MTTTTSKLFLLALCLSVASAARVKQRKSKQFPSTSTGWKADLIAIEENDKCRVDADYEWVGEEYDDEDGNAVDDFDRMDPNLNEFHCCQRCAAKERSYQEGHAMKGCKATMFKSGQCKYWKSRDNIQLKYKPAGKGKPPTFALKFREPSCCCKNSQCLSGEQGACVAGQPGVHIEDKRVKDCPGQDEECDRYRIERVCKRVMKSDNDSPLVDNNGVLIENAVQNGNQCCKIKYGNCNHGFSQVRDHIWLPFVGTLGKWEAQKTESGESDFSKCWIQQ
jgi:hypothetical protein